MVYGHGLYSNLKCENGSSNQITSEETFDAYFRLQKCTEREQDLDNDLTKTHQASDDA